jgi:NADPH:quinone reductase-like Zn-dependent oxidoreductase
MVFDVFGGQILYRSTSLVRAGGALVSIAEPPQTAPDNGSAVFFVVEPDRAGLAALERRLRDGRLYPLVGTIYPLEEAPAAFDPTRRGRGKPIIRVIDDAQPVTRNPAQGDVE